MKIKEFLTEDRWVQGAYAQTNDNKNTSIDSPDACKWCLFSLVIKCYPYKDHSNILAKLKQSINKLFNINLTPTQFNDRYEYKDILRVVEDADV